MLGRTRRERRNQPADGPEVTLLLEMDRLYLEQAFTGELQKIAPKRFNPEARAWLPILHTEKAGWHFTAMFSNTARAHQLNKTHDWLVIYFYDDHHQEGRLTEEGMRTLCQCPQPAPVVRGIRKICGIHQFAALADQYQLSGKLHHTLLAAVRKPNAGCLLTGVEAGLQLMMISPIR